jgi:hypothetical protein
VLVEFAKPVTLIVCILALYAVFYTAFMQPASDLDQKIYESMGMLALAGGICLASAFIFRADVRDQSARPAPLRTTLPWQMFCWSSGVMLILFVVSWYLEKYCVFYRDLRVF